MCMSVLRRTGPASGSGSLQMGAGPRVLCWRLFDRAPILPWQTPAKEQEKFLPQMARVDFRITR
jgi:hypothetical protein